MILSAQILARNLTKWEDKNKYRCFLGVPSSVKKKQLIYAPDGFPRGGKYGGFPDSCFIVKPNLGSLSI